MKWRLRDSFFARALALTVVITALFLAGGGWIARELGKLELDRMRRFPLESHGALVDELIQHQGMSQEKALEVIHRTQPPLVGFRYKIISAQELKADAGLSYQLKSGAVMVPTEKNVGPPKPPMRIIAVGLGSGFLALVLAIGISYFFVLGMLKRKADAAGEILTLLQSGNLTARIAVERSDEFTGLATKFNQMAEAIQLLVQNLRNIEETRRHMLAELAHDLRTPVASLRTASELIESKWSVLTDDKRKELTHVILRETQYFEKLVDDLLFLSGVDDPRYQSNFTELNLRSLLEDQIPLSDKIRYKIMGLNQVVIRGDEHLVRRLIANVLANATRFAHAEIVLTLESIGDDIVLVVQDDGPGFSAEELKDFGKRKFTRRWESGRGGHLSIGLGSTIMSKIAQLHGGRVSVSNGVKGARVSIIFPASS